MRARERPLARIHGVRRMSSLALSLVSGCLEIGGVLMVFRQGYSLGWALGAALAYQCGNALATPVEVGLGSYDLLVALGAILLTLLGSLPLPLLVSFFLLSAGVNGMRKVASTRGFGFSTFWKRTTRIAGFVLGGVLQVPGLQLGAGIALAAGLALLGRPTRSDFLSLRLSRLRAPKLLGLSMVLHQAHYFAYAYALLLLLATRMHGFTPLAGLVFTTGWMSYIFARRILGDATPVRTFLLGHALATSALLGMFFWRGAITGYLVLWFATGFGGGTVYCLRAVAGTRFGLHPARLDSYENLGHILGTAVSLGVAAMTDGTRFAFVAGAILATCAAALLWLATRRPSHPDHLSSSSS